MTVANQSVEKKERNEATDWTIYYTVRSAWYGGTEASSINEAMSKAFTDEVMNDTEEYFHKWLPITCCRYVEVSSDELNQHMVVDLESEEDVQFLRSIGVDVEAVLGK